MTVAYEIVRFFQHPKADRKVMHVKVTDDGQPAPWIREFYWGPNEYRNKSDGELVEEVRRLNDLKPDYPLECPPFEDRS